MTMPTLPRLLLVVACVAVALDAITAEVAPGAGGFVGEGTQYTLTEPNNGNCNFMNFPSEAKAKYAALNTEQFKDTLNCGRCAEVKCIDDRCAGSAKNTEVVYIVDQCPGCAHGDLDLSPDVFKSITGVQNHRLKVSWKFVDCPITGNVKYCLKGGSNEFWTAIQPTNVVSGVQSMEINGKPTKMVSSAYYFLLDGNSAVKTDLSAVKITLTSVNGQKIEDTVNLSAGGCAEGKSQFTRGNAGVDGDFSPPKVKPAAPSATPEPTTTSPTPSPTPSSTPSQSPMATVSAASTGGSGRGAVEEAVMPRLRRSDDGSKTTVPQTSSPSPSVVTIGVPNKSNDDDGTVRKVVTKSGGSGSATSPAIIALIVLAGVGIVVLVILAIVIKRKKREDKLLDALEQQVTHVSELPPLVVETRQYSELATPSKRADIAVL